MRWLASGLAKERGKEKLEVKGDIPRHILIWTAKQKRASLLRNLGAPKVLYIHGLNEVMTIMSTRE